MNRLIKLFQTKANLAWEKYLDERAVGIQFHLDGPEWHASVVLATKYRTQAETWEHAARLLRLEELNQASLRATLGAGT